MFFYTLPIFFGATTFASPLELLIIISALFGVLIFTAPATEKPFPKININNYLFSAWLGQASLSWAFWPCFLLINVLLYGFDTLAKTGNFTVSSWDEAHFTLLFPIIWWTSSVWRCSPFSPNRIWTGLYRLLTLSVFFEYALKFYIRFNHARLFFDCSEAMLDYGSCF
ncbi:hypothetical protein JCM14076_00460 [Methylosoma difficile]